MKSFADEKGLTLIEVIVAMLILVVALIPMLSSITGLFKTLYTSRNNMSANYFAVQAAEQVRATEFASVVEKTVPEYQGSDYTLLQKVVTVSNSDNNLKQVTIKILQGAQEKAKLSLVVYRKGM